jgi:hypothetical protein
MNKKQLIVMWCGISAVVLLGYSETSTRGYPSVNWDDFILWTFMISLVAGGLICTFRDKKDKKPKDEQENK